jgi:Phage integrase family
MGKGAKERIVPIGASARRALVRYLATRAAVAPGDPLFCARWGPALTARGIQLAIARLGRRAAVGTRCSPHTFRHTFARGYLVNGGDVFSLQQILGHATLDMVRRYVYFASFETVRRLHAAASAADGLLIGPRVSVFIPRPWVGVLEGFAEASRVTVQDVIRAAIARLLAIIVGEGVGNRLTAYWPLRNGGRTVPAAGTCQTR